MSVSSDCTAMADNATNDFQKLNLTDATSSSNESEHLTPFSGSDGEHSVSEARPPPEGLLSLPPELLEHICSFVFADYVVDPDSYDSMTGAYERQTLRVANPRYNLADRSNYTEDDYHMPIYTTLSSERNLGLPAGTLNALQVCIKLYQVGCRTFYGMYEFQSYSAESFRLLFTTHIGPSNLKAIRKLSIGLPYSLKTMPAKYIGRYTRMLDMQMPQLGEFRITSKFGRWFRGQTLQPGSTWIENHRGLLWIAAWVTRSHPSLKYAVWDEKNTVHDNKLDDERAAYFDERPLVELAVTICSGKPEDVQNMENPKHVGARNANVPLVRPVDDDLENVGEDDNYEYYQLDPETRVPLGHEVVKPATRLLLDSWKIRRTGFVGLSSKGGCRPYNYQLRRTAASSEASKPALENMSGQEQIEELCFHNKIIDRQLSDLAAVGMEIEVLRLRSKMSEARILEAKNVEIEMVMKRGEPEPETEPNDEDGVGWGAEDGDVLDADDAGDHNYIADLGDENHNAETMGDAYAGYEYSADDQDYQYESDMFEDPNLEYDNYYDGDDEYAPTYHGTVSHANTVEASNVEQDDQSTAANESHDATSTNSSMALDAGETSFAVFNLTGQSGEMPNTVHDEDWYGIWQNEDDDGDDVLGD